MIGSFAGIPLAPPTPPRPPGPPFYPKDELSEHPLRFFASELIREQLFLQYHEEIPYSCTVEVIQYQEREDLDYINAEIIVNRASQKGMIIGKGGKAIKKLGTEARTSIEAFVERKVFLDLHVKVREKWRENERLIYQCACIFWPVSSLLCSADNLPGGT